MIWPLPPLLFCLIPASPFWTAAQPQPPLCASPTSHAYFHLGIFSQPASSAQNPLHLAASCCHSLLSFRSLMAIQSKCSLPHPPSSPTYPITLLIYPMALPAPPCPPHFYKIIRQSLYLKFLSNKVEFLKLPLLCSFNSDTMSNNYKIL